MLQIHHSNRLEALLDHLLEVLATPLVDPLAPERIVVQHPGMGRWLAQELALRTGIAANLEFPLPARFIWDLLRLWFGDVPDRSEWDRERLVWRIFARLPGHASDPDFGGPARYLASEPRELKTYQLAQRVADLFDQYLVYRPDLVLAWEAGEQPEPAPDARWQARLWRELAADIDSPHRAALFARLEQALAEGAEPRAPLGERLLVFGLSVLPPVYGRILARVAEQLPVHLFVLSPSREYWADLVDEARQARVRALDLGRGAPDRAALLDIGNPLLASWGRGGMALQDLLLDLGGDGSADGLAHYREPDTGTLLGLIQSDLLHLHDRRRPDPAERTLLEPTDASIQVHSCHGPHRELQVLHDRLLRLFEELPGLRPRDIIVMAPDINLYAPHIEAVFGGQASSPGAIPWAIADRRRAADQPLLTAVAALLGLPGSRLGAAEVLGWLEVPAIARRFGLDARALARVRTWVAETEVRWGLDAAMRRELELPGEDANTWAFGLRRLFLGYALPPLGPPRTALYGAVLPYPDLEGPEAEALGGLQAFIDTLARWRADLPRPRPPADWAADLGRLLADLLAPDEEEETLFQPLREALADLSANARAAGLSAPLGLDILRAVVAECLDGAAAAQRFLTGRVTFCNMVPMRSIPARAVCLLGLNGTDFPRDQRPPAFDLMAAKPRRGDRSRRDDDRHLFLESLLSARERLHLSYIGSDQRDNAVRVPSVLLEELLAYIHGSFRFPDGAEALARLVVCHPLQPFSRRYFDGSDPRLYSYREDWCRAARVRPEEGSDRFLAAPLPSPEPADAPGPQTLDLDDLIRFLRSPAQWFLTRTLGLGSPDEADTLEEAEPFVQDRLQSWQMKQRLLELADPGREAEWGPVLRGAGILPHGPAGDLTLVQAVATVERFRARLAPYLADPREPLELDLPIAGLRLTGWLSGLTACGLVASRLGRARAEDQLALWARHLVLNLAGPGGVPPRSVLVTEDSIIELAPVADAEERLADLVELFRKGQTEPLPLFPKTSLLYAAAGWNDQVRSAWEGGFDRGPGESAQAAIRTAFRGRDPLEPPFEALAIQVFGPLLAAMVEEVTA